MGEGLNRIGGRGTKACRDGVVIDAGKAVFLGQVAAPVLLSERLYSVEDLATGLPLAGLAL